LRREQFDAFSGLSADTLAAETTALDRDLLAFDQLRSAREIQQQRSAGFRFDELGFAEARGISSVASQENALNQSVIGGLLPGEFDQRLTLGGTEFLEGITIGQPAQPNTINTTRG
jgi:hypothetical protein